MNAQKQPIVDILETSELLRPEPHCEAINLDIGADTAFKIAEWDSGEKTFLGVIHSVLENIGRARIRVTSGDIYSVPLDYLFKPEAA